MKTKPPRRKGTAPIKHRPRVTCILSTPPHEDRVLPTDSRVEEPTRDSIKDPGVHGKGKAEAEADVKELGRVWTLGQIGAGTTSRRLRSVRYLGTRERKKPVKRDQCLAVEQP